MFFFYLDTCMEFFFPITMVHFRSKLLRGKKKIARRHLADYVKETASKNVPHVQYEFFFLIQPIKSRI